MESMSQPRNLLCDSLTDMRSTWQPCRQGSGAYQTSVPDAEKQKIKDRLHWVVGHRWRHLLHL